MLTAPIDIYAFHFIIECNSPVPTEIFILQFNFTMNLFSSIFTEFGFKRSLKDGRTSKGARYSVESGSFHLFDSSTVVVFYIISLTYTCTQIAAGLPLDIMPGPCDPANFSLPQQVLMFVL